MRQQLSGYAAGLMPLISGSDFLDMKALTQLPNHGFHQSSRPLENSHLLFGSLVLHILAQGGLQIDPVAPQFGLQLGTKLAFVTDEQAFDSGQHLPQPCSLGAIGRSQTKGRDDALQTDQQMPAKAIKGFIFGGTIAIVGDTTKSFAAWRTLKATDRNGQAIDQMNRISEGSQMLGQGALKSQFAGPQSRCLAQKLRARSELWQEVLPMTTRVFPNAFIGIYAQKFADDFQSDDLAVSQGRSAAALAQPLALNNDFERVINHTEN
jgi:hypothetical protein